MLLGLVGHSTEVAFSSPAGVDAAGRSRPDAILSEIVLPGMDGYQVARTLHRDPVLRDTKLVAVSGYAAPEDVDRARQAGFDAHIAKPLSLQQLKEILGEDQRQDGSP